MSVCGNHMGICYDDLICPDCAKESTQEAVKVERERCAMLVQRSDIEEAEIYLLMRKIREGK